MSTGTSGGKIGSDHKPKSLDGVQVIFYSLLFCFNSKTNHIFYKGQQSHSINTYEVLTVIELKLKDTIIFCCC